MFAPRLVAAPIVKPQDVVVRRMHVVDEQKLLEIFSRDVELLRQLRVV